MWRAFLIHGSIAALLSGAACFLYSRIYSASFYVDFSALINTGSLLGACTFACTLIATGQFIFFKWRGGRLTGIYNLLVLVLSFVSIFGVLLFRLPLEISFPEMFPGLAIPMHFFPALSYFSLEPFFKKSADKSR